MTCGTRERGVERRAGRMGLAGRRGLLGETGGWPAASHSMTQQAHQRTSKEKGVNW